MALRAQALVTVGALMLAVSGGETAFAEKSGGIIKIGQFDSPAGMSILEESSYTAEGPMMGVFNNLVLYDQHEPQNSLESVRPDLATGWLWDESRRLLTLHLRHGVQWHDGKPFTAAMSNVRGTCCREEPTRSCASIRGSPGIGMCRRSPPAAMTKSPSICGGRNPPCWHYWRPAGRQSIPAMSVHATCASTRSAPAPSNLSNSSRTR